MPIDAGSPCLAIACVPRHPPGPVWRRVAWTLIILGFIVISQGWFLIVQLSGWLLLLLFLGLAAATVAMVRTGTPARRSTELVIFTRTGIVRTPWRSSAPSEFHAWEGAYETTGTPVSAVWQKLRIRRHRDAARHERVLEAGFRCERGTLDAVVAFVDRYAAGEVPSQELIARFAQEPTPD